MALLLCTRPEIRDHVILQQPTDVDPALNFAGLKELVTLGKSNNDQEVAKFSELRTKRSKEDIKEIFRDEFNAYVLTETSKHNEKHRIYRKF